jgi:FAD-dependent urate hydroxylase
MTIFDVVIIGAGPYGLAAAAHLRTVKGLEFRVFGEPMSFWDQNMPVGMFLRSNWTATQIADPDDQLTLEAYQAAHGVKFALPVPIEHFVGYGLWYQRQAVPDLDHRKVAHVESHPKGFRLFLADGDALLAGRVVIAAGIGSFAWRPPEFQSLPTDLASHSSEHRDFQKFSGKRVLIVGGGQSALESGALLHEGGAEVEIVARLPRIHWLGGWASKTLHHRLGMFTRKLLYAPTDVGPAVLSQLLARPHLVRQLPRGLQDKLTKRAVRPAGARWLVDRLKNTPIRLGGAVVRVTPVAEKGGYRVDVSKYNFLAPGLVHSIDRFNGYPRLKPGFETSVPGLHILGAPARWSFGPLMQFVSRARYASHALVRASLQTRLARAETR